MTKLPESQIPEDGRHASGGTFMSRRTFLVLGGQLVTLAACDGAGMLRPWAWASHWIDHDQAVELARRQGVGTVVLAGPSVVDAASWQCFEFVYTVGKAGMAAGSAIRIAMRHVLPWSPAQATRSDSPGFVRAFASTACPLDVIGWAENPRQQDLFLQHYPWQNIIQVIVGKEMQPRDQIRVIYGDRSRGGPGTRVQMFSEDQFKFRVYVDAFGSDAFLPCDPDLSISVRSLRASRLSMVAPARASKQRPISVRVSAHDIYSNVSQGYTGRVSFASTNFCDAVPDSYEFSESDRGVKWFEGICFSSSGHQTLSVHDNESHAQANVLQVEKTSRADHLLLWGDLHGHSLLSDGRGTPEDYYRFAREVAGLDVCALTDHDILLGDAAWTRSKRATNDFYQPGSFVTLQGYEWSGLCDRGGDHNVYFLDADPPLYRCISFCDIRNQHAYHGPTVPVDHIMELFHVLLRNHEEQSVLVIPHYGGRPAQEVWHHPKLQRLIEVFSDHGRYGNWAMGFYSRGYSLGCLGSSDSHIGRPGCSYLPMTDAAGVGRKAGKGLVGIYAKERTREAVFDALYQRRVYATSGARIVLRFTANGHEMGCKCTSDGPVRLAVEVTGTHDIAAVRILKDFELIRKVKPATPVCRLDWTDSDFEHSGLASYIAVVSQVDGETAVSSPIWVRKS